MFVFVVYDELVPLIDSHNSSIDGSGINYEEMGTKPKIQHNYTEETPKTYTLCMISSNIIDTLNLLGILLKFGLNHRSRTSKV